MRCCLPILLALLLLACGGGGHGSPSTTPPRVSNLTLTPNAAWVGAQGSTASSVLELDFTDSDGDVTTFRFASGSTVINLPISGVEALKSGYVTTVVTFDTSQVRQYSFEVSLLDAKGLESNRLGGTFTVAPNPPLPPILSSVSPLSFVKGAGGLTLTAFGTGFSSASKVLWNGSQRATTFVSPQQLSATLLPSDLAIAGSAIVSVSSQDDGGGASQPVGVQISDLSVLLVPGPVIDAAWDSARFVLYAAVQGTSPQNPASVVVVDPSSGSVLKASPLGGEPSSLSLSSDGAYLYVGLRDGSAVRRFRMPDLSADLDIPLGPDAFGNPQAPLQVEAAPDLPATFAVLLGRFLAGQAYPHGIAVFDGATRRPVTTEGQGGANRLATIQWGSDASRLHGSDDLSTAHAFFTLDIDTAGVHPKSETDHAFGDFGARLVFDRATSRIFSCTGQLLDASTGTALGTFPAKGAVAPASSQSRVYYLGVAGAPTGSLRLRSFDQATFIERASTSVPWTPLSTPAQPPTKLLRWGQGGLASCGGGNPLLIISGPFMDSAPAAAPGRREDARPAASSPPSLSRSLDVTLNAPDLTAASGIAWKLLPRALQR